MAPTRTTFAPSESGSAAACKNARLNLRDALDLIVVHAERPVRGTQPRAALNPTIAVASVSAWERFIADLVGAVTVDDEARPIGSTYAPGTYGDRESGLAQPDTASGRLRNLGYLDKNNGALATRWVADVPTGWFGVQPRGWLRLGSETQADWGVDSYLKLAILVRNAGAHRAAADLARTADRKKVPFLDSDAKSTTVQHGYARGVVALVIQVLDSTIAAVCADQNWPEVYRLPQDWFQAGPHQRGRYEGIDFWGRALPRA